jgi:hypothetical protein
MSRFVTKLFGKTPKPFGECQQSFNSISEPSPRKHDKYIREKKLTLCNRKLTQGL